VTHCVTSIHTDQETKLRNRIPAATLASTALFGMHATGKTPTLWCTQDEQVSISYELRTVCTYFFIGNHFGVVAAAIQTSCASQ